MFLTQHRQVDEAHERSVNSDIVMGLLKKIRRRRTGLRLVICSATIDAKRFLDFFVGAKQDEGTIISIDGRLHPVDILYLERPARNYISAMIDALWDLHSSEGEGDVLCFLPSAEEIDRAIRLSEERFHEIHNIDLLPLYASLPLNMQSRVLFPSSNRQKGYRRVIFATNIAETSLTVPGVMFVIDSGLVKLPYFDPRTGFDRLIVGPVSKAGAAQRAGRAGRIAPGKCFRLYTESTLINDMSAQTPPEILRTNLSTLILSLKSLGVDNVLAFDFLDIPSVEALSHGLELLFALGAIDDQTNATKLGLDISTFPVDVPVARMLLESVSAGCSWEVLAVAGALQVRDLLQKPRRREQQQRILDYESAISNFADASGDHVTYVNILSEAEDRCMSSQDCQEQCLNYVAVKRALEVRNQLARILRRFGKVQAIGFAADDARSRAIRRCVTAGFFFNIAKLDNDGRYYTLRNNLLVTPASTCIYGMSTTDVTMGSSEYIVFGETSDGSRGGIELRHVSAIDARWLRELAPNYWK